MTDQLRDRVGRARSARAGRADKPSRVKSSPGKAMVTRKAKDVSVTFKAKAKRGPKAKQPGHPSLQTIGGEDDNDDDYYDIDDEEEVDEDEVVILEDNPLVTADSVKVKREVKEEPRSPDSYYAPDFDALTPERRAIVLSPQGGLFTPTTLGGLGARDILDRAINQVLAGPEATVEDTEVDELLRSSPGAHPPAHQDQGRPQVNVNIQVNNNLLLTPPNPLLNPPNPLLNHPPETHHHHHVHFTPSPPEGEEMDTSTPGRPQSLMASAVAALHGIRRPTDPLALQDPAAIVDHHLHIQPLRSAQSAAATAAAMAGVRPSDQQVPAPNPHQYREPDRSLPSSPAAAASEGGLEGGLGLNVSGELTKAAEDDDEAGGSATPPPPSPRPHLARAQGSRGRGGPSPTPTTAHSSTPRSTLPPSTPSPLATPWCRTPTATGGQPGSSKGNPPPYRTSGDMTPSQALTPPQGGTPVGA